MISNRNLSTDNGFTLTYSYDGIDFSFKVFTGENYSSFLSVGDIPDGWNFITVSVPASSSYIKIYVNGSLVSQNNLLSKPASKNSSNALCVGSAPNGSNAFNGKSAGAFMYSRILTDSEISSLYYNYLERVEGATGATGATGGTGSTGSATGATGYFMANSYTPAILAGEVTFPDHNTNAPNNNPNLIGLTGYAIWINRDSADGVSNGAFLNNLIGQPGEITLSQGSLSATLSFTSNAFYGGFYSGATAYTYSYDSQHGGPGGTGSLGRVTLVSPSAAPFTYGDPIQITINNNI
jgi:hypothetical protein